jgi:hypothetical protein
VAADERELKVTISDEGTPQSGIVSPLLSNLYLHEALDHWFAQEGQVRCRLLWADTAVAPGLVSSQVERRRWRISLLDKRVCTSTADFPGEKLL